MALRVRASHAAVGGAIVAAVISIGGIGATAVWHIHRRRRTVAPSECTTPADIYWGHGARQQRLQPPHGDHSNPDFGADADADYVRAECWHSWLCRRRSGDGGLRAHCCCGGASASASAGAGCDGARRRPCNH